MRPSAFTRQVVYYLNFPEGGYRWKLVAGKKKSTASVGID